MASEPAPAFDLPPALRAQGYALRPEREDDLPFLLRLYGSTREAELAPVPWSAEQKQAFVASQFALQRHHYRTQIEGCRFAVIEHGGTPAGRLYLDARPTRLHIVDIALLPEWRGRGLGTAILQALLAYGAASGRAVDIFVERFNPALRLYRRLGFVAFAEHDVFLEMEWLPDAAQLNTAS